LTGKRINVSEGRSHVLEKKNHGFRNIWKTAKQGHEVPDEEGFVSKGGGFAGEMGDEYSRAEPLSRKENPHKWAGFAGRGGAAQRMVLLQKSSTKRMGSRLKGRARRWGGVVVKRG